jgi:hypothetical protein
VFPALPDKPDADALERAILEFWAAEDIFGKLRARNAGGPRFSFIDGPVTANKVLGVHTAWGRTLKDVFLSVTWNQTFQTIMSGTVSPVAEESRCRSYLRRSGLSWGGTSWPLGG